MMEPEPGEAPPKEAQLHDENEILSVVSMLILLSVSSMISFMTLIKYLLKQLVEISLRTFVLL